MYVLSEEGCVLEDYSSDPLIPGLMCYGASVIQDGKIYAVGKRVTKGKSGWQLTAFDGKKWCLFWLLFSLTTIYNFASIKLDNFN